jgi:TRAP-type C4-dicarboxylate transport system permease small subunit
MMRISFLETFVKVVSILLLAILVAMVFFQVASRSISGVSFPMIEELATLLFAWCSFIAASYTIRKKAHVAIEFFVELLPARMQETLSLLVNLTIFIGLLVLFYASIGLASRQMLMPMAMVPLPRGIIYISFPVGIGFASIFILSDLILGLTKLRAGNKE